MTAVSFTKLALITNYKCMHSLESVKLLDHFKDFYT